MSNDTLDTILDIKPDLTKHALEVRQELIVAEAVVVDTPVQPEKSIDCDLAYSRNKLKEIIDSAQITLQSAIEAAEETSEPRAFEVVGTMIQAIVQANKELLLLHKTKADTLKAGAETGPKSSGSGGTTQIFEKAIFVGRSQDLLRELKAMRKAVEKEE